MAQPILQLAHLQASLAQQFALLIEQPPQLWSLLLELALQWSLWLAHLRVVLLQPVVDRLRLALQWATRVRVQQVDLLEVAPQLVALRLDLKQAHL